MFSTTSTCTARLLQSRDLLAEFEPEVLATCHGSRLGRYVSPIDDKESTFVLTFCAPRTFWFGSWWLGLWFVQRRLTIVALLQRRLNCARVITSHREVIVAWGASGVG